MKAYNKKISYVIVDTENYVLGLCALQHSIKTFPLDSVLIFSDRKEAWPGFDVIEIPKITKIDDYNRFILTELCRYVETEFCLIIQYDGFVTNGSIFSDLFLEYDYIGATWHHFDHFCVGCGGMSLRSTKLLKATAEILRNATSFETPEDLVICRFYRVFLEENYGLRFAPKAIANHFSQENKLQPWNTFSFHGLALLPLFYENTIEFLFDNLGPQSPEKMQVLETSCSMVSTRAMQTFEAFKKRTQY